MQPTEGDCGVEGGEQPQSTRITETGAGCALGKKTTPKSSPARGSLKVPTRPVSGSTWRTPASNLCPTWAWWPFRKEVVM